jgi:lysozyme
MFLDSDPHDWIDRSPAHYGVHGVDVSKWQGDIDWRRVRASGAAFAFIKATEGDDHMDDRFAENWVAAGMTEIPPGA